MTDVSAALATLTAAGWLMVPGYGTPVSVGGGAPYLGQVATRCFQNNNYQLAAAGRWQGSRTGHWARDKLSSPKVIGPGWYNSDVTEALSSGGTLKLSIEYPTGVFTLADECIAAGNGPVAMSSGNMVFTFTGLAVPKGKKFRVRSLMANDNGVIYRQFQNNGRGSGPDPDDGWEIGTGTPIDKTMSGTFTSNVLGYFPVAIVSSTSRPSFLIFGDSHQEGGWSFGSDITYDVGYIPRAVGRTHAYSSMAASGTLLTNFLSSAKSNRVALAQYFSHVVDCYGVNDLNGGGRTAVQLAADRTTFAGLFPSNVVVGTTITPVTSSTDGYFTTANQTVGANGQAVLTFNDLVRAGTTTGEAFFWDVAAAVDPLRTGKWPVSRDFRATTYGGNQATFTGSIANSSGVSTLTVTTFTSGDALKVGDCIVGALNGSAPTSPDPGVYITALGTGTGGTGTYILSKPGLTVSSQTLYTGGRDTNDGLHGTLIVDEAIRDGGVVNLALAALS